MGAAARQLTEPGALFDGLGFKPGSSNDRAPVADGFPGDSPAEAAGLIVGDRVVAIDGQSVETFGELVAIVSPLAGETVSVEVDRGGETLVRDVTVAGDKRGEQVVGVLGINVAYEQSNYYYRQQYGAIDSVGRAIERTGEMTVFTVKMLWRMVTGEVSFKNISGPINIAQFAGESAERGLSYFLGFLAVVSISLGVLNLMPIPILDGGQIVYQVIEGIRGTPLSERAQILGQQVGIFALLMLMSFAFYNDLARLFG